MDYRKAIGRVFDHLEEDRIEAAVMGCLRIARNLNDYANTALFVRELNPEGKEVARIIQEDLSHLKREATKFIYELSAKRWMEIHTFDFQYPEDEHEDEDDKKSILRIAVGEIDRELEQLNGYISDKIVPSGMSPYDTAAFADRHVKEKAQLRWRIKAIYTIRARIKALCLNYCSQMGKQIQGQERSQSFLEATQNEVNNFFKSRSDDTYQKLLKAAQLASSTDLEDASLLLTEVRRASKAAADYWYPPVEGKIIFADGKERQMGEEQYLNRLQEFISTRINKSTSKEVLQSELILLSTFIRRINDMASKGVHASVTLAESLTQKPTLARVAECRPGWQRALRRPGGSRRGSRSPWPRAGFGRARRRSAQQPTGA